MNAKERFDAVIDRCTVLLDLHKKTANSDLLRSVVVFGVAALDAYAVDRFMEEFVPYVKGRSLDRKTISFLKKAGVTVEFVLGLIKNESDRPFRQIRTLVEDAYEIPMQSFKKTNDLYGFYGIKDVCNRAADKTKTKSMLGKIQKMILRRHEIVHAADYNGKNQLQNLKSNVVENWQDFLRRFVDAFETIVVKKFGK